MVLSGDSLSLELPLDMRAAMEKALAREESCGLGGGVYSMATARGRGSVRRCPDGAGGRTGRGWRSRDTGNGSAPGAARSPALTRGRGDPIGRRPIGAGTRQGPRPGPARPRGRGRRRAAAAARGGTDGRTEGGEGEEGRALPARRVGRGRPALGSPQPLPFWAPQLRSPPGPRLRFGERPPLL